MEQNILGRINQLKTNVQEILHKFSDQDFETTFQNLKEKIQHLGDGDDEVHPIKIDNYEYISHYPEEEDLPLTLAKDPEPGVHYYDTENSPMAAGAPKAVARGIDKFDDEEEEFDEVLEEDIKRRTPAKPRAAKKKTTTARKRKLHQYLVDK